MKMNPVLQSLIIGALFVLVVALVTRAANAQAAVQYGGWTLDIGHLITAIKRAENWDGKTMGARGEWGPLQMTPLIRKQFEHDERAYIRYLFKECAKLGKPPTAWLVGLLHNAGYPAVRNHTALAAKLDFAERVENLYNDLNRSTDALSAFRNPRADQSPPDGSKAK